MKCQFCDQKATVHLEHFVEGISNKMHLCLACAEQKGVTGEENFSLEHLFASVEKNDDPPQAESLKAKEAVDKLIDELQEKIGVENEEEQEVCDYCGFTLEDLQKVGRMGCSHCYRAFRGELVQMVEGMHKGSTHIGRAPQGAIAKVEQRELMALLRGKLEESIGQEQYERAAELRDEIRQIEQGGEVAR